MDDERKWLIMSGSETPVEKNRMTGLLEWLIMMPFVFLLIGGKLQKWHMELEFNEFQHPYLVIMNMFFLQMEYGSLLASCLLTTCLFSSPLLSSSPALQQELLKPWQVLFLFPTCCSFGSARFCLCVCWLAVHSSLFICAYLHEWLVMLVLSFQK